MEINAKQARDLMKPNSSITKKLREELDDLYALIERAAKKGNCRIATIKISKEAVGMLTYKGFTVTLGLPNCPSYIAW